MVRIIVPDTAACSDAVKSAALVSGGWTDGRAASAGHDTSLVARPPVKFNASVLLPRPPAPSRMWLCWLD